jgi:hypothetical protein
MKHPNWEIQMIRMQMRPTQTQEREAILRPLARLIARRLQEEGLAASRNTGQTMAHEQDRCQEVAA